MAACCSADALPDASSAAAAGRRRGLGFLPSRPPFAGVLELVSVMPPLRGPALGGCCLAAGGCEGWGVLGCGQGVQPGFPPSPGSRLVCTAGLRAPRAGRGRQRVVAPVAVLPVSAVQQNAWFYCCIVLSWGGWEGGHPACLPEPGCLGRALQPGQRARSPGCARAVPAPCFQQARKENPVWGDG